MSNLPDLIPVNLKGVLQGIVMLTPDSVAYFKEPHFWAARAQIPISLNNGVERIYSTIRTSSGESIMIGVYKGGLIFPSLCPVTLAVPETDVVAETSVSKCGIGYKTEIYSKDAGKIRTALASDRYWFTVHFARNHGMKDRAIGFINLINKNGRNNAVIMIKKRQYAQEFARLNHLSNGKWLSMKHILMRTIGFFVACIGVLVAGLALVELLTKSQGTNFTANVPRPIMIISAVLGVLGIVLGIVFGIVGMRGEDL